MLHVGPHILWNIRTGNILFEHAAELKYLVNESNKLKLRI